MPALSLARREITNILTIDVEDYFQVSAFEAVSPPETWEDAEWRVERNTQRLLDLLEERGVRATFFVLGWVAQRFPDLVRRMLGCGHEVASHGYGHRRVCTQTPDEFREDVRRSKALLEDLTGHAVLGYRAPSYSISQSCIWAFDELHGAGYTYDSSVFPVRHDLYGMPFWPRFPFCIERLEGGKTGNWVPTETTGKWNSPGRARLKTAEGVSISMPPGAGGLEPSRPAGGSGSHEGALSATLLEVPITTLRVLGKNLPIAGGGYFRLLPYRGTRWGLRRINRVEGRPFVFYIHPWEFDPEQPRLSGAGLKSRFRHYLNLEKTEPRFRRLLADFSFAPISEVLRRELSVSTEVEGVSEPVEAGA